MLLKNINEMLDASIDDLFCKIQKELGIETGDISPDETLRLENLEAEMAEVIIAVIRGQMFRVNMTLDLTEWDYPNTCGAVIRHESHVISSEYIGTVDDFRKFVAEYSDVLPEGAELIVKTTADAFERTGDFVKACKDIFEARREVK